jgi:hypothetical protein
MRKLNRVALDKLPMDLAFKRVKGNGARKLIIFSDADCPFCHRLEDEMKAVDNVTIYNLPLPHRPDCTGFGGQVEEDQGKKRRGRDIIGTRDGWGGLG